MRDWQETTLDQAVQINPSVKIQSGTNSPFVDMKQVEAGHKFVRAAEWRTYTGGGSKFISGDTLMARITPCLENGKIGQYRSDDGLPTNGSTEFIVFRGKPGSTDNEFTYYLITSPDVRNFSIGQMTGTSGRQRVPTDCFSKLTISLPPLSEQRAIAAVLGALDDKIELNRRMNATLEAMARALFKSWFVDFDPVRAKMAGKQPFGMDATTAALFPSRLVPSSLGDIPEGWSISNVGTEFDITMGQSPPGETYNESGEGLPFYQGRTDFGFRYPTRRIFCTQPNRVAEAGDTLISVRAPVGDINMAFEKCILGRGVGALRHKSKARSFTYYAIHSIQEDIKAFEADGTVFGSINKQDVEKLSIIKPSSEAIKEFEKIIQSSDEKILSNIKEILELEKQRDYLLPKLISGDIRIPDAEKFVEAA